MPVFKAKFVDFQNPGSANGQTECVFDMQFPKDDAERSASLGRLARIVITLPRDLCPVRVRATVNVIA